MTTPYQQLLNAVLELYTEIDCRIEHGADSNRHLDYVRSRLKNILAGEYE